MELAAMRAEIAGSSEMPQLPARLTNEYGRDP